MMKRFISDIKERFQYGDILTRLIIINIVIFALILISKALFVLFGLADNTTWRYNFQWSWDLNDMLRRPWTLITYMFTSYGLWHLIFNMFTLYWFGKRFQELYTNNQLRGLYFLGAGAGMIFYTALFHLVPSLQTMKTWTMPGASTAILSIAMATLLRNPNRSYILPIVGAISIKYLVVALVVVDVALIPNINAATDFAHLGAICMALLFNKLYREGKDITQPITSFFIWLDNQLRKKLQRR